MPCLEDHDHRCVEIRCCNGVKRQHFVSEGWHLNQLWITFVLCPSSNNFTLTPDVSLELECSIASGLCVYLCPHFIKHNYWLRKYTISPPPPQCVAHLGLWPLSAQFLSSWYSAFISVPCRDFATQLPDLK